MALKAGDAVDVVEKSETGRRPCCCGPALFLATISAGVGTAFVPYTQTLCPYGVTYHNKGCEGLLMERPSAKLVSASRFTWSPVTVGSGRGVGL